MAEVFCYGTLKDYDKPDEWFINALMYKVCDRFPGIKLDACTPIKIFGQVIDADEQKLAKLDYIEGVPFLYNRKSVIAFKKDNELVCKKVWVYEFAQSVDNMEQIGKWPI